MSRLMHYQGSRLIAANSSSTLTTLVSSRWAMPSLTSSLVKLQKARRLSATLVSTVYSSISFGITEADIWKLLVTHVTFEVT